jgi:hypothetical protein
MAISVPVLLSFAGAWSLVCARQRLQHVDGGHLSQAQVQNVAADMQHLVSVTGSVRDVDRLIEN